MNFGGSALNSIRKRNVSALYATSYSISMMTEADDSAKDMSAESIVRVLAIESKVTAVAT